MSKNISIEGVDSTIKFLSKKNKDISQAVKVGLQESGILLKEEIENSIAGNRAEPRSVDTGEFLASIESNPEGDDTVIVSSDVPQSAFMEYGTVYIPERRHFRNSSDRLSGEINQKINEIIKDEIE